MGRDCQVARYGGSLDSSAILGDQFISASKSIGFTAFRESSVLYRVNVGKALGSGSSNVSIIDHPRVIPARIIDSGDIPVRRPFGQASHYREAPT